MQLLAFALAAVVAWLPGLVPSGDSGQTRTDESADLLPPYGYLTKTGEAFLKIQQNPDIAASDIEPLADGLLSKALHLCYLGYAETVYGTDRWLHDVDSDDKVTADNGNTYYRVTALPYKNTEEFWEDIYTVFSKDTADAQLAYMFQSLYVDIDGVLYARGGGVGKQRDWDVESMQIASVSENRLKLNMTVQLMADTFPATLEVVFENGRWVLNDTYFAYPKSEKDNYYDKYIAQYYIAGLLYDTWNSPSDIDPNRLLKFYEYNVFFDIFPQMSAENPGEFENEDWASVDAVSVEAFMLRYFNLDVQHLRDSDAYEAQTHTYRFRTMYGIGGGSGVEIAHIEREGDTVTFYCEDISDNELSVTIQISDNSQFRYVRGTGVDD